ncbi:MAG: hypothetical protein RIS94_1609 [Pseudomonadota bacterium]
MRFSHWILASGSTLALAAFAAPAVAQTATPQDSAADAGEVKEIIVTAQFREQRLQDTPLAITAVPAAVLEARSQTSITDVGSFAPNVNLAQATAINANAISAYIRGIGQDDSSFALEPGVGIYVDDVYYGTTFGAVLDLVDLDRVEVLRGPQGTLAGKNSLGGSVKLFTRKPDENGGGSIEAGSGSYNRINLRGSAGVTLADGLYARVSGTYDKRDGYFKLLDYGCANPDQGIASTTTAKDCVTGTQGGLDVLSLRGALRYAPSGSPLEVMISGDYARNHSEAPATKLTYANLGAMAPSLALQDFRTYDAANPFGGVSFGPQFLTGAHSYSSYENYTGAGNYTTIFGFPAQVAPGTFPDPQQNSAENWGVTGTIDYKLPDSLSLKSITAFRKASGYSVLEIDGAPMALLKEGLRNSHRQFTQELRLSGKVGDMADFTIGGFYYKAHDRAFQRIMIPTFQYDFLADDRSENRSIAGFANLELHPTEALNLIGGLRYTDDEKTYSFGRTNADGSPISGALFTPNWLVYGLDGLSATYKGHRWDYRLGANYRFSPELMVYGQVSTGYKGGGINPRPFVADQIVGFGAENVTTFEGGFKANVGSVFRLNGAYFYNKYKDIQRTLYFCPTSASVTCSEPTNAGNGHSQGVELEAMLHPVAGLTIDGSMGYLDFKYDSINPFTGVTLDMVAPFNAKWTGSAGIQYDVPLGSLGKLTPRIDWSYQSSFYASAVNNPYNLVGGRSLFNARVSWTSADDAWVLSAAVTNLGDKFYYVGASENVANFGLSNAVVGRPREWSLSIKRKF